MAADEALTLVGPWGPDQVSARWTEAEFEPPADVVAAADEAIAELRDRGSPSHDGPAARLVACVEEGEGLVMDLQPARWALRLVGGYRSRALSALCVVRDEQGRWLAGRRASWVASWAGQWALGAGGSVEVGENPADTLWRELREEWSLEPVERRIEAVFDRPDGPTFIVGTAVVDAGAEPVPDAEHDEWAWWPPNVWDWPDEASEQLRLMAGFLTR